MAKFKNEKGLTLIELLITISVLAVVSAIALPVINNVVSSSNSNASAQTQSDVTDFITKYNAAGETLISTDGRTLQGFVDTDGDNTIDSNEMVDTLTIDSKFSFSAAGTSDTVGGTYTTDGITGATTGLASAAGGSTNSPSGYSSLAFQTGLGYWWASGTNQSLTLSSYDASAKVLVVSQPVSAHGMCMWDFIVYDASGNYKGSLSSGYGATTLSTVNDGTNCTFTANLTTIEADKGVTIDLASDIFVLAAGSWAPNTPFKLQ